MRMSSPVRGRRLTGRAVPPCPPSPPAAVCPAGSFLLFVEERRAGGRLELSLTEHGSLCLDVRTGLGVLRVER